MRKRKGEGEHNSNRKGRRRERGEMGNRVNEGKGREEDR